MDGIPIAETIIRKVTSAGVKPFVRKAIIAPVLFAQRTTVLIAFAME